MTCPTPSKAERMIILEWNFQPIARSRSVRTPSSLFGAYEGDVRVLEGWLTVRHAADVRAVQMPEDGCRQLRIGAGLDAQDLRLLALLDPHREDALEPAQALDRLVRDPVDL